MLQPAHALELQLLLTCRIDFFLKYSSTHTPHKIKDLGDVGPGEGRGYSLLCKKDSSERFGKNYTKKFKV